MKRKMKLEFEKIGEIFVNTFPEEVQRRIEEIIKEDEKLQNENSVNIYQALKRRGNELRYILYFMLKLTETYKDIKRTVEENKALKAELEELKEKYKKETDLFNQLDQIHKSDVSGLIADIKELNGEIEALKQENEKCKKAYQACKMIILYETELK